MRSFVLLVILSTSFASNLITTDEIQNLFVKFLRNEVNGDHDVFEQVLEILHRPEYVSARALESNSNARNALDCIICRSAFAAAFQTIKEGQTGEELTEVITTLCTVMGIEGYAVCRGAVALNIPIIEYIIRNAPQATPGTICSLLLQNSQSNVCPFTDDRFDWSVDLPEPPAFPPVLIVDNKPFKAAVMTDFHIDPLYEEYGVADCDEPTCCRKGQSPKTSYRYQLDGVEPIQARSIVSKNGTVLSLNLDEASTLRKMRSMDRTRYANPRNSPPAGFWGDYRNCDTPVRGFDDAIERIAETHKDIDVVYYIGDTIDHFVWETTYDLINEVNRYAIEKMKKSFGENVLIIPAIGNHESQPTNQFAPSSVTGPKVNTTWLYEALANKWSDYLPESALASFKERGEYSILVRPGLRVIVINNNVAYRYNWWLAYDPQDSKRHLEWLVEELRKAELAGENVHILAHIPPGVHDLTYTWTREYNRIINRFSSIIKAEFNGHTHSDEFKLFYSLDGRPTNVAWGAGSVTSYTFYNLNYKIATFDGVYEPQNIVNYVYNLTEANLTPNRRPHWFQLYDMKNTFGLNDLSAASMDNLVHRMVSTDLHLLDMYSAFFTKLSDSRMSWCGDWCKLDYACRTVISVLWQREKCEELTRIFYSRQNVSS